MPSFPRIEPSRCHAFIHADCAFHTRPAALYALSLAQTSHIVFICRYNVGPRGWYATQSLVRGIIVGTRHNHQPSCALSFVAQYIDFVERPPDDERRVVVRDQAIIDAGRQDYV